MAFATIGTRGIQAQSVDLTSKVTGTLPVPNGGLGIASGTSGQFLKFTGTTTIASAAGGGITEIDQWRITANHSGVGDITANWERVDTDGFSKIGTGMSQSSGIFTFPGTGVWSIQFITMPFSSGEGSAYIQTALKTTVDNSSYDTASRSYTNHFESGAYSNGNSYFIFDVTNTSTHKCKFSLDQNEAGTPAFQGNTGINSTFATFLRLGDT